MQISKAQHYQGHALTTQVLISGQDIKEYLSSISDISYQLDYPSLTEYRVSDCTLDLRDPTGIFSPENDSNFFITNKEADQTDDEIRTGFQVPVVIKAGFIIPGSPLVLQTMFTGNIVRLNIDAKTAVVKIVCSDISRKLRNDKITDLGLEKQFRLIEDRPQTSSNGTYSILKAVNPISNESENLFKNSAELTNPEHIRPAVEELETEGLLNSDNYTIGESGVTSEGGFIDVDVPTSFPQLEIKAPFRYRDINQIVDSILDQRTEILTRDLQIPSQTVDYHFSSNGRVGYEIIGNIGSSNPLSWEGYVTDVIYDDNKFYFLYNVDIGDTINQAAIIEYNTTTKRYNRIHRSGAHNIQYWKFVKHETNFYILATDNTIYDSAEINCGAHIRLFNIGTNVTDEDFVPKTAQFQPQLAHFYGIGTQLSGSLGYYQKSKTFLPDSRRNIIYHNGLYYTYVDRTNEKFGIAKATNPTTQTKVIEANMDEHENHAGLAFKIDKDSTPPKIYGAVSFKTSVDSTVTMFTKDL